MNYQIYYPCEELKHFIQCYWSLEATEQENIGKQVIVPDGHIEFVFHYGSLYKKFEGSMVAQFQPRCFLLGQLTRTLEIFPSGDTGIFAVRFFPGAAEPLLSLPVRSIENNEIDLEKIYGEKGKEISLKITTSKENPERIRLIESFLLMLLENKREIDMELKYAIDAITKVNGNISVNDVSDKVKVQRRQLERKFSKGVGFGPKKFIKMIRLQYALRLLLNNRFSNLADLTYKCGYFDQAHFIKDFKEFTGIPPTEFFNNKASVYFKFYGMK